jgi:hypothetical protein
MTATIANVASIGLKDFMVVSSQIGQEWLNRSMIRRLPADFYSWSRLWGSASTRLKQAQVPRSQLSNPARKLFVRMREIELCNRRKTAAGAEAALVQATARPLKAMRA